MSNNYVLNVIATLTLSGWLLYVAGGQIAQKVIPYLQSMKRRSRAMLIAGTLLVVGVTAAGTGIGGLNTSGLEPYTLLFGGMTGCGVMLVIMGVVTFATWVEHPDY